MSWAKQAEEAKGGADGAPYMTPGNYSLETQFGKYVKKFKGGEMLVTRFKVLESDNPNFKPGDEMDWCVNIKNGTPWHDNIKDFVSAAGKMPRDQIKEADFLAMYTEKEPSYVLKGLKVRAQAFNRPTAAGDDFTRVRWITT